MRLSLGICFGIFLSISTLKVNADPIVPCYFIFGDSLSDAGNNNNLTTKAKANYLPYGIDNLVNSRPTGRFTNGLTLVDVIATQLRLEENIAPFSEANEKQIVKGVNYASGSAGIRPETGEHLGKRISLGEQLSNHKTIISRLGPLIKGSVRQHLHKCLYTIDIGSNDYLNNYFVPDYYLSSRRYNPRQFANELVDQYSRQITTLYKNGARKVVIFGLGSIGCALAEVIRYKPETICVNDLNEAVTMFNTRLEALVQKLNKKLPGSRLAFINTQAIGIGPGQGITVFDRPCCTLREDFQCKEDSNPCEDRNAHYFWDGFHPTQAANKITGAIIFNAISPLL